MDASLLHTVDTTLVGLCRGGRIAVASLFPTRADVAYKHLFAGCDTLVKQWVSNAGCTLVPFVSPACNDGSVDQTIYIDALGAKSGPAIVPATRYIAVATEQVRYNWYYSQPDIWRFFANADAVWAMDLPDWSFQTNPHFAQRGGTVVPRAVVPAMLGTHWNDGTEEAAYGPAPLADSPLPRCGLLFGTLLQNRQALAEDVRRLMGERGVPGSVRVESNVRMGPGLRDALRACSVTFVNNAYEDPCMPTLHRLAYAVRYLRPGAVAVVEQCDQAPLTSWLVRQWWPIVHAVPLKDIADCVVQHMAGLETRYLPDWHAAAGRVRACMAALWAWDGAESWVQCVRRALPPAPVQTAVCVCFPPVEGGPAAAHVADTLRAALAGWPSAGALTVGLAGPGAAATAASCIEVAASLSVPLRMATEAAPEHVARAWTAAVAAACLLQTEGGGSHVAVLRAGADAGAHAGGDADPQPPWRFRSADVCNGAGVLLAADGRWECVGPASFTWKERPSGDEGFSGFVDACEEGAGPRTLVVGTKHWAIGTCVLGLMLADREGCRPLAEQVLTEVSTAPTSCGAPLALRAAACRRLGHLLLQKGDEVAAQKALMQAVALHGTGEGAALDLVHVLRKGSTAEVAYAERIVRQFRGQTAPEAETAGEWAACALSLDRRRRGACVAFFVRHFSERGTEVSIFAYAHHNEALLGNRSIIVHYPDARTGPFALPGGDVYARFARRFRVFEVANAQGIAEVLRQQGVQVLYTQASGGPEPAYYSFADRDLWRGCGTIKHAVFQTDGPEGDVYCGISPWVVRHDPHLPVLPLIVEPPTAATTAPPTAPRGPSLRSRLGIPSNAVVFGRHGGKCSFNVPMAQGTVARVAERQAVTADTGRPIYFLFMNTNPFCRPLERVKHLPCAVAPEAVAEFIEACDAMLHARAEGETFGLACAEFAVRGKPVLSTPSGDQAHLQMLGGAAVLFDSAAALEDLLLHYDTKVHGAACGPHEGYGAVEPGPVMATFAALMQLAMDRAKARDAAAAAESCIPGTAFTEGRP